MFRVRGPVSDFGLDVWYQVIGPRGGIKSEWYTKAAAQKEARRLNKIARRS